MLATGRSVGGGIATGPVRLVASTKDLPNVEPGDILVADTTNPDWEPVLKTAAAVVTNRGRTDVPRRHRRSRARDPGRSGHQ